MAIQTYGTHAGRSNVFLQGEMLAYAIPFEVLSRHGRQARMSKHSGKTYIARRYLPHGGLATDFNTQNQFFPSTTGDRGNVYVQEHQSAEGVTPTPDSLIPVDVQVDVKFYKCLYGFTDEVQHLYEDDIPEEMKKRVGNRMTLVNEHVIWGQMRGSTNQFFAGGTTMATVDEPITLGLVRDITSLLQENHGLPVNEILSASEDYGTTSVEQGFFVFCHTDLEPNIRDMRGFKPVNDYASGGGLDNELGTVERFRFVCSPDLVPFQDAGAAIGATGLKSTTGTLIDVYQFAVAAQDAWSKVIVRGLDAIRPTYLSADQISKADPLGDRGYVGGKWLFAALVENDGWLAIGNVGVTTQVG